MKRDAESNTPTAAIKLTKEQKSTITVVIITSLITTFTASALNLSIPAIGEEFKAGASSIGWIINGFILASAAMSVPFGRIADLTGRKRILVTGILIFSLCCGGIILTGSMELFIALRIAQGIGAAMIFATNQAVLISAFPPQKRGKVLGYSIASTYTGLSAGPVVGGFLNHYLGWRSIFILTFIISVIVFVIAAKKLPASYTAGNGGQSTDMTGIILYVGTIVSIMYGLSAYSTTDFAKYLIPAGIIIMVMFIYHELRIKSPIIKIRLFIKNTGYLLSNISALLNYGATFAIGYLMSIYLQIIKGYDSQISGIILISQPLIMALLSPYAGKLSDRISPFRLASFGMALCALGLFSFTFVSEGYPLILIIANLVVVGVGFAFFSSPNTNAVMACVEPMDYGVASSILATMRTLGQSTGMAVLSFIVAHQVGNVPIAEANVPLLINAMRISFIVFTALCILGVFFSLKRKEDC